jgi:hypothetical protein
LIKTAQISSIVQDFKRAEQSLNAFELQYSTPPGDLADAYSYWGDDCHTDEDRCNGNGDGQIDYSTERGMVWKHARLANLVDTSVNNVNTEHFKAKYNDGVISTFNWTFLNNSGLMFQFGGAPENVSFLTPQETRNIDKKLDDGKPGNGRLYGLNGGSNVGECLTGALYNLANDALACRIFYFP